MVISSSQLLLRNSVAANILIVAGATQIVRWAEVIENPIPMAKSDTTPDEQQQQQQQVDRYSFVEPKVVTFQHPWCYHHYVQTQWWDKLFDCWQGHWNVTFCSGSNNNSTEEQYKMKPLQDVQTPLPDHDDDNNNVEDDKQPSNDSSTPVAFIDSKFRQRRLTQYPTSASSEDKNNNNSTISSHEEKSSATFIHGIQSQSIQNNNKKDATADVHVGALDSSVLGVFSCHGLEPRIHDYSILVDEMACTSMIQDSKETHEDSSNKLYSLIQHIFSGTFFQRRVPTGDVDHHHDLPRAQPPCPDMSLVTSNKINQDRAHVLYPTMYCKASIILGCFDGHGDKGELVAEYIMSAIEQKLSSRYVCSKCNTQCRHCESAHSQRLENQDLTVHHGKDTEPRKSMQELYTEIFREVDREIGNQPLCRPFHSGSTACVVLLSPSKLYVANVGDSRAVLGSRSTKYNKQNTSSDPVKDDDLPGNTGTIQAIELTIDQNANDPVERQRILDAGGHVTLPRKGFENEIPARVWLDDRCTQIGLGMSRSFGDFVLKDVGVIVDPVVTELDLDPGHEFLIVATDGVWEFIDSSDAVNIVHDCLERGMDASEACQELINCAKERWKIHEGQYRDDITAIILRLDNLWTDEGLINYKH